MHTIKWLKKRKSGHEQSIAAAAYKKGMDLYFKKHDPTSALRYLIKAAKAGYSKA